MPHRGENGEEVVTLKPGHSWFPLLRVRTEPFVIQVPQSASSASAVMLIDNVQVRINVGIRGGMFWVIRWQFNQAGGKAFLVLRW